MKLKLGFIKKWWTSLLNDPQIIGIHFWLLFTILVSLSTCSEDCCLYFSICRQCLILVPFSDVKYICEINQKQYYEQVRNDFILTFNWKILEIHHVNSDLLMKQNSRDSYVQNDIFVSVNRLTEKWNYSPTKRNRKFLKLHHKLTIFLP